MQVRAIGAVSLAIDTGSRVTDEVARELRVLPIHARDKEADVVVHPATTLDDPPGGIQLGNLTVTPDAILHDHGAWVARLSRGNGPLLLEIAVRSSLLHELAPNPVSRLKNWNYLTRAEDIAKAVIYDALDPVLQLANTQRKQTFLHASALISPNGEVAVFGGWGGVGKTSTILSLVLGQGYRYLSDDLVVIDSAGIVYRSPKRLQIYPYNTNGNKHLEHEFLKGRSWIDTAQWKGRGAILGPKRVRRRIAAEELFGSSRVGTHGKASRYYHLLRGNFTKLQTTKTTAAASARMASNILLHELQPLPLMSAAANAVGSSLVDSIDSWRAASEEVLLSALADAECTLVHIPALTSPEELASFILHHESRS